VIDLSRVNINLADEPLNIEINARIERTMIRELPRGYLGASAVGHECMRQTQYAWWSKPLLPARVRSIFDRGHYFEVYTRQRLVNAGFVFAPPETLAFTALNGDLQGHADGVIIAGPHLPGAYLPTPCVWEHKALTLKTFAQLRATGLLGLSRAMRSRSRCTSAFSTSLTRRPSASSTAILARRYTSFCPTTPG
jgi:hypothetical protein